MVSIDKDKFKEFITKVHDDLQEVSGGENAQYIPQLAEVNPELLGISVTFLDGSRFHVGDTKIPVCIQSVSKPFLYCTAQSLVGSDTVHQYIGHEPSGRKFNAFALDDAHRPHNPMINTGAIVSSSLIYPREEPSIRFQRFQFDLNRCCGKSGYISFDNGVYLSEKGHAERNRALSWFMMEHKSFPPNTNLEETLDLYFQACSVSMNIEAMSVMAATLANGGICPLTAEKVFDTQTVRNCTTLMYTCGMYDYSGRFAFEMGYPAKSGVSGIVMLVIPGVMGIVVWSPPLDDCGNSVRGVEFCKRLVAAFPRVHLFERLKSSEDQLERISDDSKQHAFYSAASQGDLNKVKELLNDKGVDLQKSDHEGRTAIHMAASEGHYDVVDYLRSQGADMDQKDKYGNTPALLKKRGLEGMQNPFSRVEKRAKLEGLLVPPKDMEGIQYPKSPLTPNRKLGSSNSGRYED